MPIVPAAILFDLGIGDDPTIHPSAECGYLAAQVATNGPVIEGSVGAGTGATVGKLAGPERAMKGGIGTAMLDVENGVRVAALMAVNAVGNIVDPESGQQIAGVRSADGVTIVDARSLLRSSTSLDVRTGENTTIGVVATNARLSKAELAIVARMAHDGLARAVRPAHTPSDGDTIFAIATGEITDDVSLLRLGALAADVTANAILRGVRAATGLPGYPSATDLEGGVR